MNPFVEYVVRVGDATSQLINVAIFLSDNPNESVSGRAYRLREDKVWWAGMKVLNAAFFWQENHCRKSYDNDVERAKAVLASAEE